MSLGINFGSRMQRMKQMLQSQDLLLILEAHNALSALIAENTLVQRNNSRLVSMGFGQVL